MQRRRRNRSPTGSPTGGPWRPLPVRTPPVAPPHTEPALRDNALFERQGLQAQVTVAAIFVAISGGIFFAALRRTFEIMP